MTALANTRIDKRAERARRQRHAHALVARVARLRGKRRTTATRPPLRVTALDLIALPRPVALATASAGRAPPGGTPLLTA